MSPALLLFRGSPEEGRLLLVSRRIEPHFVAADSCKIGDRRGPETRRRRTSAGRRHSGDPPSRRCSERRSEVFVTRIRTKRDELPAQWRDTLYRIPREAPLRRRSSQQLPGKPLRGDSLSACAVLSIFSYLAAPAWYDGEPYEKGVPKQADIFWRRYACAS